MNTNILIILFGFIILLSNLAGGYHLDEQVKYPHNKIHAIAIPKEYKKYFMFSYKKRRREYLKAAYIFEIIGYVEFLISLIVAGTLWLFNYPLDYPNRIVMLIITFSLVGINEIYVLSMYTYYKIKYK
jgi:hypothetical protein